MKAITIDLNSFIPVSAAKEHLFEPRKRRGKIDIPFLVITLILLTFGLVMLFSASYAYAFYNKGNSFYYIERQLLFAVMGVAAMLAVSQINYKILQKYSLLIYADIYRKLQLPAVGDCKICDNRAFCAFCFC